MVELVDIPVLEAGAERHASSSLAWGTKLKGVGMKSKDVLDRAYGSIAKEPTPYIDLDWIPTPRGIKYYWLVLIRKFTR